MNEAALLTAIEANPDDESPRLIYSDWLDEQGRTDEAELIRIQCQLAKYQTAHRDRESELLEIIAQKPPVQVAANSWKVGQLIVTQKRSF